MPKGPKGEKRPADVVGAAKVAPTDGEVSHATLQGEMLRARKVGWD
jgi:hypothetical protein